MAVPIPRSSERALPTNQTQVVREQRRAPETSVSDAMTSAGSALEEFGNRMRDAEIAADITEAEINTRSEMDKTLRDLQADGTLSHDQITKRYGELSRDVLERNTGKIRSPAHKRVWQERAKMILADGENSASRIAMDRRVGTAKAKAITMMDGYETMAADPSTLPEVLEANEASLRELVQRYQRTGVYSPEEAARQMVSIDGVAMGAKSVRVEAEITRLMNEGQYALAEEYMKVNYGDILPARRQSLENAVESKSRIGRAVQTADGYWAEAGGDYGAAMEKARGIENVDDRLQVEERLNSLRVQDDQARRAVEEEAESEGWSMLANGGTVASIPLEIWGAMSGEEQAQMRNWERVRNNAEADGRLKQLEAQSKLDYDIIDSVFATNPELYNLGPEGWKVEAPDLYERYSRLQPDEHNRLLLERQERRAEGYETGTVMSNYTTVKNYVRFAYDNEDAQEIAGASSSDRRAFRKQQELEGYIMRYTREWTESSAGGEMDEKTAKDIIRRSYRDLDAEKFSYDPGSMDFLRNATSDYAIAYEMAREKLQREPTNAEVQQAYRQLIEDGDG